MDADGLLLHMQLKAWTDVGALTKLFGLYVKGGIRRVFFITCWTTQ